jgi:hypothetical protein
MTRLPLKRKNEDPGGYPAVKRVNLMQLSGTSMEDTGEVIGALGNTTSSAHSNLLLNDKGDDKDDDVLVVDADNEL